MTWKVSFFLIHGRDPLEGCAGLFGSGNIRILKLINKCTLLIESPDGKTRKINVNNAKPVSATTAADNALQEFKQLMLRKEHTHPYTLHSSSM